MEEIKYPKLESMKDCLLLLMSSKMFHYRCLLRVFFQIIRRNYQFTEITIKIKPVLLLCFGYMLSVDLSKMMAERKQCRP